MSNSNRIGTGLPQAVDQTKPQTASGELRTNNVARLRDGFYAALQRAIDVFGGESRFADAIGASLSDTHLRINRKEDSKLKLQRAFYDYLAHIAADERSCFAWLSAVNELLGYEPPIKKRVVSEEEIGRGALAWLKTLPASMREAARADIAASLGIRVEALKL